MAWQYPTPPMNPGVGMSEEAGRVTRPRRLPLASHTPSPLAFSHPGVPKALVPRSAVSALGVQMVCRLAEHRPTRLACAPSSLSQPFLTPLTGLWIPAPPWPHPDQARSPAIPRTTPGCILHVVCSKLPGPGKSRTFHLDGQHNGTCPAVPAAASGSCSPQGDPGW